jgi:hypothetical protein
MLRVWVEILITEPEVADKIWYEIIYSNTANNLCEMNIY